jgi:hypothetical protein
MKNPKQRIQQIMDLIREAKSESLDPMAGDVTGWGFWRTQCSRYGDLIEMQVDELLTAGLAHPAAAAMTDDQVNAELASPPSSCGSISSSVKPRATPKPPYNRTSKSPWATSTTPPIPSTAAFIWRRAARAS